MSRERDAVINYLAKQKILIADTNSSSRVGLAKTLIDMGAVITQVTLVDSYEWAEEVFEKIRPSVVVCDYHLGSRCGLDLLSSSQKTWSYFKPYQKLSIIVTKDTSQAAVARAMEGDVDLYITKPYSLETLRNAVVSTIQKKVAPSPYLQEIYKGLDLLEVKEYEEAIKTFQKATKFEQKPALAFFYLGHSNSLMKLNDFAQKCYKKGLTYNEIHFKCLMGLYETFTAQNNIVEAYEILKKLTKNFPLNPNRFLTVLSLAVKTGNYQDIEDYYEAFLEVENKDELVKHTCAALIVAGKHFLSIQQKERALSFFHRAGITAAGRTPFLRQIIVALVENGECDEADKYLRRFPADSQKLVDYQAMDFLIASKVRPLHIALAMGRKLVQAEIHDPVIYKTLIQVSRLAGHGEAAEMLVLEMKKRWPALEKEIPLP